MGDSMKSLLAKLKNSRRDKPLAPADNIPGAARTRSADDNTEIQVNKRLKVDPGLALYSVVFRCLEGSVTHYYHFFYGAMVPLIFHALDNGVDTVYCILTDLGPMKRIIGEIPLNVLVYEGPNLVSDAKFHDDKSLGQALKPGETALPAYDAYNTELYTDDYVIKMSKSQLRRVGQFFRDTLPDYIRNFPVYDIILIERSIDSYYEAGCSNRVDIYKTSGAQRRRIINHSELVAALKEKFGDLFCNIVLERSSIYYQYYMFNNAKVVIAQHGAALANTIFMMNPSGNRSSAGAILEFSPPWSREFQHFKNLAHACGINHVSILQDADIGNVDVTSVLSTVDELLAKQSIPVKSDITSS